jgi:hypothetical protein
VITTPANDLVSDIHDRMPLILAPSGYARWLSDDPHPRDLMCTYPAGPMRMWPISTRVNKPENDDPSIFELWNWPRMRPNHQPAGGSGYQSAWSGTISSNPRFTGRS